MKKILACTIWSITFISCKALTAELSFTEKEKVLNELQSKITNQYVLTENIDVISAALSKLKESKEFKETNSNKALAKVLATEIRKYDGHFSVLWNDPLLGKKQNQDHESWFSRLSRKNSGFSKVEILKGNIGYIDFVGFAHLNESSEKKPRQL